MNSSHDWKSHNTVQSVQLIRKLLRWRLQYYINVTADALRRNTQMSVLLILAFGPLLLVMLLMLAKPLLLLLNATNLLHSVLIWGGLLAVSIIWVILQRRALMGGLPNQYLQCLPIQPQQRFITDFYVLFSTNAILFIPYLMALLYSIVENPDQLLIHGLLTLLWMCTVILLQLQFLYRIRWRLIAALGSIIRPISLYLVETRLLSLVVACAYVYLLYLWLKRNQQSKHFYIAWIGQLLRLKAKYSVRYNLMRIYVLQLMQSENHARLILLCVAALLPIIIIPLVEANIILENFLWIRWKESGLLLFITSLLIILPISLLVGFQLPLKTAYQKQLNFFLSRGVGQNVIDQAQQFMLFLLGMGVLVPVLITTAWLVSGWHALLLIFVCTLLLWSNIWLYRKPDDLHVVAKIVIFAMNVGAIRLVLAI